MTDPDEPLSEPQAMPASERVEFTHKDLHDAIASQIDREDGLVNIRLTWMLNVEGILFAGVGLIAASSSITEDMPNVAALILFLMPILGFAVAVLAIFAVRGAILQRAYLANLWKEIFPAGNGSRMPRPFGETPAGDRYCQLLPISIAAAWVVVLLVVVLS